MRILLDVVFCAVLLASGQSYVLPVDKCHLEDSKCMVSAFQKFLPTFYAGIPELGVEQLNNFDVDFDLAGLKFSLKNSQMEGLENAIVDNVEWDVKKQRFETLFHVDCSLKGQYTGNGKVLAVPVKGNGDFKLDLKNLSIKMILEYDVEKREDGKNYIRPKKYSFEFDVKDDAVYHVTNLFDGNKELSDKTLNFVNENGKQISNELGTPVVDSVIKKYFFERLIQFFDKLAIEDIAIV